VTVPRLKSFLFVVIGGDGTKTEAVFYASSASQALGYAREWAERLGHRSVQIVLDRERVA
jgi:hypothetical protein